LKGNMTKRYRVYCPGKNAEYIVEDKNKKPHRPGPTMDGYFHAWAIARRATSNKLKQSDIDKMVRESASRRRKSKFKVMA
jgi:hypothetical protein